MKDTRNITIAVLSITAVVLLALLIGTKLDSPAYAMDSTKQGDYIMATGAATAKMNMLYMVNVGQRRMNVYAINSSTKKIDKWDTFDLDDLFSK